MPWGTVTPACLCECEKERREKERLREKQESLKIIYRHECFAGSRFKKLAECTFEKDDYKNPAISQKVRNYAADFDRMTADGKGLLFYGNVGTGKSFYAACIANYLIDNLTAVRMTSFAAIRNDLQENFEGRKKYLEMLNETPLLIIDDLATESNTQYMNEVIYDVINSRYNAEKPLIVTTNLTGEELKSTADTQKKRIYSRLFEMCIPIEFDGEDRRRDILKEDYKIYKDILGS